MSSFKTTLSVELSHMVYGLLYILAAIVMKAIYNYSLLKRKVHKGAWIYGFMQMPSDLLLQGGEFSIFSYYEVGGI